MSASSPRGRNLLTRYGEWVVNRVKTLAFISARVGKRNLRKRRDMEEASKRYILRAAAKSRAVSRRQLQTMQA